MLDDSERLATAVRNHAGRQDRPGSLLPRRHKALRTKTANRSWTQNTLLGTAILQGVPPSSASVG